MFSLIQVIVYLNIAMPPSISILTHFNNFEKCEKKLNETKGRAMRGGLKVIIDIDEDNLKYLKIINSNEKAMTYWYCKKTIFYKKN